MFGLEWFAWKRWLGWVSALVYGVKRRVLLVGLDHAGKSTLCTLLSEDRILTHTPTQRPGAGDYVIGNLTLTLVDMGGHEGVREIWEEYAASVDAIVFVVDAADRGRMEEARFELNRVLSFPGEFQTPVLVLGNKVDIPSACSEMELRERLGLQITTGKHPGNTTPGGMRDIEVFMCSFKNRSGYQKGFEWLTTN